LKMNPKVKGKGLKRNQKRKACAEGVKKEWVPYAKTSGRGLGGRKQPTVRRRKTWDQTERNIIAGGG